MPCSTLISLITGLVIGVSSGSNVIIAPGTSDAKIRPVWTGLLTLLWPFPLPMGKPLASTISISVWMCGFRFVWVYLIYPLFPKSLTYLYLVWPIGWVLSIITLLCIFFPTVKKLDKKAAQNQVVN